MRQLTPAVLALLCASCISHPRAPQELRDPEFAVSNAPSFDVPAPDMQAIQAVIEEVSGGYGGTLVCAERDTALDSPGFVAQYLRAFAGLRHTDCAAYSYRFELLLARLAKFPEAMADPRLDWDMMRAFLEYVRWGDRAGRSPGGRSRHR